MISFQTTQRPHGIRKKLIPWGLYVADAYCIVELNYSFLPLQRVRRKNLEVLTTSRFFTLCWISPETPGVWNGGLFDLPQQNFNAWFGNTSFSQKWVGALNGKLIEKKVLDGVCKYRMLLSIQE